MLSLGWALESMTYQYTILLAGLLKVVQMKVAKFKPSLLPLPKGYFKNEETMRNKVVVALTGSN